MFQSLSPYVGASFEHAVLKFMDPKPDVMSSQNYFQNVTHCSFKCIHPQCIIILVPLLEM